MLSFIPIRASKHRSNWDKHKRNNPKLASSLKCYRILMYFDSACDGSLGNDETRYSRSFGEATLPLDACLSSFPAYWCPKFPSLTQLSAQYLFPFVRTCLFIINQNIAGCKCSPCLHLVADSWFFMVLRLHSDGFFRTSCTELSKTNPAKGLLANFCEFSTDASFLWILEIPCPWHLHNRIAPTMQMWFHWDHDRLLDQCPSQYAKGLARWLGCLCWWGMLQTKTWTFRCHKRVHASYPKP